MMMNKKIFLEELKQELNESNYTSDQINEIIEDYDMMITEAIERNEDEETFISRLGTVRDVVRNIKKELPSKKTENNRIIAIMPFVSVILFFALGFGLGAWQPGWLVFLLIPITAISIETKGLTRMVALSPFVCTITFILLGHFFSWWHPMWAIFLFIIPLGLWKEKGKYGSIVAIYTVISIVAYMVIAWRTDTFVRWHLLILGQLIPVFVGVWLYDAFQNEKGRLVDGIIVLSALLVFIPLYWFVGNRFGLWHPTWLIFLLIPMMVLLYHQLFKKEKVALVAYIPFIATIGFFLWGEYGKAYHYSWLVFLLIPIVAILGKSSS